MKKNLPSWRSAVNTDHPRQWPILALLLCCSLSTSFAQINLLKDINTAPSTSLNEYSGLVNVSGNLYFIVNGSEIWKTDGTATTRVKTFRSVQQIKPVGGTIYVVAEDSLKGSELWRTDGTESGTVLIKDIAPGVASSAPGTLSCNNGILYFIANDGKKGREVWRSDGTNAGTYLLRDIANAGGHCNCRDFVSYNNNLYFVALDKQGYELWQSDGTKDGTHILKDIKPGKNSSSPNNLTVSGNFLYFSAKDDLHGEEVWRTDGTEAGTIIFKDVRPGATSSFPTNFVDAGNQIFFRANDGEHGFEFWRTDGTDQGTRLAFEIAKGKTQGIGSFLNATVGLNNKLYFIIGRTAYVSDGTDAGTRILGDMDEFYERKEVAVYNNEVYVIDNDYELVQLLKFSDSGLSVVKSLNPRSDYNAIQSSPTVAGNYLYLVGEILPGSSVSLLRSDGTADGTIELNDIYFNTSNSNPRGYTTVGNTMYFSANDGSSDGLWKTDGTTAGTELVKHFPNGTPKTKLNDEVIFVQGDNYYSNELWKSNGTAEGTIKLKTFNAYSSDVPGSFIEFKGEAFFSTSSGLWKTNGTEAGTSLVRGLSYCCGVYNPYFVKSDSTLYFFGNDGSRGNELWKTDGTTAGTSLVVDLMPGFTSTNVLSPIAFNHKVYFVKVDGNYYSGPFSVWKSDGTAAGTSRIASCDNRGIQRIDAVGNAIYFIGYDPAVPEGNLALYKLDSAENVIKLKDIGVHSDYVNVEGNRDGKLVFSTYNYSSVGYALWISNGTPEGTIKLANVGVNNVVTKDHILYFYVTSVWPYQFWRSDGTVCGTFKISARDVGDREIAILGNKILLSGNSVIHGYEPYYFDIPSAPLSPCGGGSARVATAEESVKGEVSDSDVSVKYYTNPFAASFSLNVKGSTSDKDYNASITNMNGSRIENHSDLKRNTEYTLGANLQSGLYILRVVVDGKVVTKRISKLK